MAEAAGRSVSTWLTSTLPTPDLSASSKWKKGKLGEHTPICPHIWVVSAVVSKIKAPLN